MINCTEEAGQGRVQATGQLNRYGLKCIYIYIYIYIEMDIPLHRNILVPIYECTCIWNETDTKGSCNNTC